METPIRVAGDEFLAIGAKNRAGDGCVWFRESPEVAPAFGAIETAFNFSYKEGLTIRCPAEEGRLGTGGYLNLLRLSAAGQGPEGSVPSVYVSRDWLSGANWAVCGTPGICAVPLPLCVSHTP